MLPYPDIKPYIIKIGPLQIRWYGLMYLLGFVASYMLVRYQIARKNLPVGKEAVDSLYFSILVGLLVGARLGYVLFYNLPYYVRNPLEIVAVWQGGMSFHGGLIGAIVAGILFCIRRKIDFWLLADLVIVTVPIGLGLGRLGNFINAELWGRPTFLPWGMVFPHQDAGNIPRHPSQLYEFFLEGIVLFTVLWVLKDRVRQTGILLSVFLILYGLFRFLVEFFREPDRHLGFVAGFFTMGQILSVIMIVTGAVLYFIRKEKVMNNA